MSRKILIFATEIEAYVTLCHLKIKSFSLEKNTTSKQRTPLAYLFDEGLIVISGVGINAAEQAVYKYFSHDFKEIWNFGMAGALQDTFSIGQIFEIGMIGKYHYPQFNQSTIETNNSESFIFKKGARLVSSYFPIHHETHRNYLRQNWELVDMEGYGIAYAASSLKISCRIWKIVSDFASPGGKKIIQTNKMMISKSIFKLVTKLLDADRSPFHC
ncbi:MAG: hypothetical protein R3E91_05975 [Chlamydiales bacterium]